MPASAAFVKKRLFTRAACDPDTLGALLAARLTLAEARAIALVARGAVQVGGRRASDASGAVALGAHLTVFLDEEPADALALTIVYRDPWLLVVDKPAGMLSQPSRGESSTALDERVRAQFADARMMHRLDRDASGLVLFALSIDARAPLQAALEAGEIDRRYLAVVSGRLEGEGRIALRIGRDAKDERRRIAHPESSAAGQPATSRFRTLRHGPSSTVVELELETGRTHQLRLHLSAIGHPILGDRLYGGPPALRLCLHAERLALTHPQSRRPIIVTSPPPGDLGADDPP